MHEPVGVRFGLAEMGLFEMSSKIRLAMHASAAKSLAIHGTMLNKAESTESVAPILFLRVR